MILFVEIKKKNSKICQESKELQIAKTILRKNKKVVASHFLISKYISQLSKQKVWYWHKNRHIYQWNRKREPGKKLANDLC